MQTFLPYADFIKSAKALDYRRLGKQRVEGMQLLKALASGPVLVFDPVLANWVPDKDYGGPFGKISTMSRVTPWYNHPACKMWRGYEQALTDYTFTMIHEWTDRGYKDTCYDKICDIVSIWSEDWEPFQAKLPPWFGDETFHAAHRSNLLRKDPNRYSKFDWSEPNDLPYVWPVK